jgi:hypothetical protein
LARLPGERDKKDERIKPVKQLRGALLEPCWEHPVVILTCGVRLRLDSGFYLPRAHVVWTVCRGGGGGDGRRRRP